MKWKRSNNCGELRLKDCNKEVILMGWVDSWRDHGGLRFIDIRDRYGITQLVFSPEKNPQSYNVAKKLRREYVIAIKGKVASRPKGMANPNLKTGEIEILVEDIEILNESKTTPFQVSGYTEATEELRLKYRYLDLRRPELQRNFLIRHRMYQSVRRYFDREGFVEIETPFLMKSTPEGARDYLVPSRIFKGWFYALPQSPQTYKQILMISGFDKYFQIVKCFRDEDLRIDRQPEFTQIDMEMSFVDENDVFKVVEGLMTTLFKDVLNREIETPFPRLTYQEAIKFYGTDKPDLRWDMPITEVSDIVKECEFKVFSETVKKGGIVCGISARGLAGLSRKEVDNLSKYVQQKELKGLVSIKIGNEISSILTKFLSEAEINKIIEKFSAKEGDLILLAADKKEDVLPAIGALRLEILKRFKFPVKREYVHLWVTEFPLFEYNEEEKRWDSTHHPFTSPDLNDIEYLERDPSRVRSKAYDLVLNGSEIASGSIRIWKRDLQEKIFKVLNLKKEEAEKKFGFLLKAFEYGAPPHGGIAFGFDRMVMIFCGTDSIRDVIAFPKTNKAYSLMEECPSEVSKNQLDELGIRIVNEER
ncbi:aspartate--tRNA ligase [candidate division KSB1 bacterium]|nr:MAG: aspartate--tRNA ligase [candidate division KSB1 bacterium]